MSTTEKKPREWFLYCFRNGEMKMYSRARPHSKGLLMGHGEKVALKDFLAARARLAYDNTTWLCPGVPEAENERKAFEAVVEFRAVMARNALGISFTSQRLHELFLGRPMRTIRYDFTVVFKGVSFLIENPKPEWIGRKVYVNVDDIGHTDRVTLYSRMRLCELAMAHMVYADTSEAAQ